MSSKEFRDGTQLGGEDCRRLGLERKIQPGAIERRIRARGEKPSSAQARPEKPGSASRIQSLRDIEKWHLEIPLGRRSLHVTSGPEVLVSNPVPAEFLVSASALLQWFRSLTVGIGIELGVPME